MTTIIKDCIYRFINVPELCQRFIDTPEFQRLRRIKQLGVVHYVYPSAVHTRLEHSIGVMHLAGQAVDSILYNSTGAINITKHDKELIMLAGLLHDIGHMAFSHMFDDVAGQVKGLADDHEDRSLGYLKAINDRYSLLNEQDIVLVGNMIMGIIPKNQEHNWMYQIVNNKLCDVDVDKMDYLQRDAYHTGMPAFQPDYIIKQMCVDKDGNLAFKKKARADVENIFTTRKRMFENVYYHKTIFKLDNIYRSIISSTITRLDYEQIVHHFGDDCQAEAYLRREYPRVFNNIDNREFKKATELCDCPEVKSLTASYIKGCNDLNKIMSMIIFV